MIRPARCGTSYARSLPATLRTPDTGGCDIRVKIDAIIEAMRHERYRFSPARRVFIPKKNGKLRPLGLPSWSDKLVGEVMRLLLEAYYEPTFSGRSHGFRPGRGCHTALREMQETWTGTVWFVEGDMVPVPAGSRHPVPRPFVFGVVFPAVPSGVLRDQNCLDIVVQLAEINIGEYGRDHAALR